MSVVNRSVLPMMVPFLFFLGWVGEGEGNEGDLGGKGSGGGSGSMARKGSKLWQSVFNTTWLTPSLCEHCGNSSGGDTDHQRSLRRRDNSR